MVRIKFLLRRPISESVDGGIRVGGGRNIHRSEHVVFGLFFAPDPDDAKERGTIIAGGPKRFRGDMLNVLRVFKSRDIYKVSGWGNKEKWGANKRSRKQFEKGIEVLRVKGWRVFKVTGFRRLMG